MDPLATRIIVFSWAVVAIVWDVFLARDSVRGNTWTEQIRKLGRENASIPFILGALLGHFFFGPLFPYRPPSGFLWLLFSVGSVAGISAWVRHRKGPTLPAWTHATLGTLLGGFLWGG